LGKVKRKREELRRIKPVFIPAQVVVPLWEDAFSPPFFFLSPFHFFLCPNLEAEIARCDWGDEWAERMGRFGF
jgi:hypothetical protein